VDFGLRETLSSTFLIRWDSSDGPKTLCRGHSVGGKLKGDGLGMIEERAKECEC
jgi:hypothetical protein